MQHRPGSEWSIPSAYLGIKKRDESNSCVRGPFTQEGKRGSRRRQSEPVGELRACP